MSKWTNHKGGAARWTYVDGLLVIQDKDLYASRDMRRMITFDPDTDAVRTKGAPKTAAKLHEMYGADIARASQRFDIRENVIAGVILSESGRAKKSKDFERDEISERHESGFESWNVTPHRGSAGLGQQLLTTARAMVEKYELQDHFKDPYGCPRELQVGDIIVPSWGIFFTAAYLRDRAEKFKTEDSIKLTSMYNTGGLYESDKNKFNLRAYGGEDRFYKHAAYANDYLVVMRSKTNGAIT